MCAHPTGAQFLFTATLVPALVPAIFLVSRSISLAMKSMEVILSMIDSDWRNKPRERDKQGGNIGTQWTDRGHHGQIQDSARFH